MKTRRSFIKETLGCICGFIGISTVKARNNFSIKPECGGDSESRVEIEYLYLLMGNASLFGIQRQDPGQSLTTVIEAPFFIYWDGYKGHRRNCPMGNIEIDLVGFIGEYHLLQNIDIDKLTNWIISHLIAIPDHKRTQKFVLGEMAWKARISLETVKTLQKEQKNT